MVCKILKWIGYGLLALLLLILLFVAFNWTLVSNMVKVGGAKITDVGSFQPAETVNGCPGTGFRSNPAALSAETFTAMRAYSDKHGGVGLIVLQNGQIAGEAYRRGANAKTRASSQSLHKTVVAMVIGAAVRDGVIASLDAPVGDTLNEWRGDSRGKLTFRQLLSMSSGLHNPSMSKMELPAMNMMLGDVSDAALSLQIERNPGTFNYSNANFQIAGMALSRALKKAGRGDYAAYLADTLWCPLGNSNASLWLEHPGGEARYFAYLDASVRDWARVGELIRLKGEWNGKQVLPAAWIDEMIKASPANPNYGLGIWRGSPWTKARRYSKEVSMTATHSQAYLADDVVFLDGFGGQRVYVVPSTGLVIARSGETSMTWDDAVLVNLALRGIAAK